MTGDRIIIIVIDNHTRQVLHPSYHEPTPLVLHEPPADALAFASTFSGNCTFWGQGDRFEDLTALRAAFFKFLVELMPPDLEPNPLTWLARCVNALELRIPLKVPRWRAGRWKAKT